MNKLLEDYIYKMEQEFGEDWTEYLPVYYHEQRKLIEGWGFNVQGLSDEQVGIMFPEVITNELCGNAPIARVNLDGLCSTCSVMEWILMHGCPRLDLTHFEFPKDKILFGIFAGLPKDLVVSSIPKEEAYTDVPVEKWHEPIKGIRRIMPDPNMKLWYCEISGQYYYITG